MVESGAGVLLGENSPTARLEKRFSFGFASTGASGEDSYADDSDHERDTALAEYPAALRVRNTFLEFPVEQLLRLDGSAAHRRSRSCPPRLRVGDRSETGSAVGISRCSSLASLATEEGVPDVPRAWVGSVTDQLHQFMPPPPFFPAASAPPAPWLPQPPLASARWPSISSTQPLMSEVASDHSHMYPSRATQNVAIGPTIETCSFHGGCGDKPDMRGAEGTGMSVVWAECSGSSACRWAASCNWSAGREVKWQRPKELELGSPELPTVGSANHHIGKCKPCAFVHRSGCSNGVDCPFCHLCDPDEKKHRQKERWEKKRRQWRQWRHKQRMEAANSRKVSSDTACGVESPCSSDDDLPTANVSMV